MKKNLTELVLILDKSGSMAHLTDDTVGGFNSVLKQQNNGDGEVLVTTVLFNEHSEMLHDRLPIAEVKPMTEKDYIAGGCTALLDALGGTIRHIADIHRYAREEDRPEHTVFMVTTDGMENSSREFTAKQVKEMVRHEQEKYGWEFIFLAANIDAVETAEQYGIAPECAVSYMPDSTGTERVYDTMNNAVCEVRCARSLHAKKIWRQQADEDFEKRGR